MAVTMSDTWKAAQMGVIGALAIAPEEWAGMIFQKARPEHFGNPTLRHVFEAAHSVWAERRKVDPVTILQAAGDEYAQTIQDCMVMTPTYANTEEYLDVLKSEARISQLQKCGAEFAFVRTEADALEIFSRLGMILRETDIIEDLSLTELINDYLDRMNDPNPPDYLCFGIQQLDKVIHVTPGSFVVIAADSSVGKTALSLQFAYSIAAHGKRVGFFSLETPKENLEDRLMAEAQVANIALPRTKAKTLTNQDYMRAADAGTRSTKIPMRVLRRADTIADIKTWTIMHGFDVIFIDYLQIIDHGERKNRTETVASISMELHRMAQKLGVTVVALSQITPPEDGSDPTMDDLRESRQIKNDADFIMMLMPDREKTFPHSIKMVIEKNKDGKRKQKLLLVFDAEHMTFSYGRRVQPSTVPGQQRFRELGDDEGGENPFPT